jgi:hypothetical protein
VVICNFYHLSLKPDIYNDIRNISSYSKYSIRVILNNGELSDYTEIELPATSHRLNRQDIWSLYLPELSGRIFNELIFLMHESAKGSRDKNIYIASSGCLTEGYTFLIFMIFIYIWFLDRFYFYT